MRHQLVRLALTAVLLHAGACGEEADESVVWGTMKADASMDDRTVNGNTLAQEGADYRGFCRYRDNAFSFGIGDPPPVTDFRFEIYGIEGPPTGEPYLADGTLRGGDDKGFEKGQIWNSDGGWVFGEADINPERCNVVLFAEAGDGDLTPAQFGMRPFKYVLKIVCHNGLNYVESRYDPSGPELTGFELALWFDNCDT